MSEVGSQSHVSVTRDPKHLDLLLVLDQRLRKIDILIYNLNLLGGTYLSFLSNRYLCKFHLFRLGHEKFKLC
ncbi:unnamed protein product [Arabidopsis halleri]